MLRQRYNHRRSPMYCPTMGIIHPWLQQPSCPLSGVKGYALSKKTCAAQPQQRREQARSCCFVGGPACQCLVLVEVAPVPCLFASLAPCLTVQVMHVRDMLSGYGAAAVSASLRVQAGDMYSRGGA